MNGPPRCSYGVRSANLTRRNGPQIGCGISRGGAGLAYAFFCTKGLFCPLKAVLPDWVGIGPAMILSPEWAALAGQTCWYLCNHHRLSRTRKVPEQKNEDSYSHFPSSLAMSCSRCTGAEKIPTVQAVLFVCKYQGPTVVPHIPGFLCVLWDFMIVSRLLE